MYNFDFEKPSTIADAVSALAADEAQALGGGQTLIPTLKQRLAAPSVLVSLGANDAGLGKPLQHIGNALNVVVVVVGQKNDVCPPPARIERGNDRGGFGDVDNCGFARLRVMRQISVIVRKAGNCNDLEGHGVSCRYCYCSPRD